MWPSFGTHRGQSTAIFSKNCYQSIAITILSYNSYKELKPRTLDKRSQFIERQGPLSYSSVGPCKASRSELGCLASFLIQNRPSSSNFHFVWTDKKCLTWNSRKRCECGLRTNRKNYFQRNKKARRKMTKVHKFCGWLYWKVALIL